MVANLVFQPNNLLSVALGGAESIIPTGGGHGISIGGSDS